jgi:hypothetical protein
MPEMDERGLSMVNRRVLSSLGIYVYGVAAVSLGLIGLVWRDFATNWQRVQENVPHRETLAYLAAVCEFLGGSQFRGAEPLGLER